MAGAKHYRSFRLYLDNKPEEVPASTNTDSDVLHIAYHLGDSSISIRAKRQYFTDSKLLIHPGGSRNYRINYSQMVTAVIFGCAIWLNTGNWKADVLFMAAFVLLVIKGVKMVMPWLRRYWRE